MSEQTHQYLNRIWERQIRHDDYQKAHRSEVELTHKLADSVLEAAGVARTVPTFLKFYRNVESKPIELGDLSSPRWGEQYKAFGKLVLTKRYDHVDELVPRRFFPKHPRTVSKLQETYVVSVDLQTYPVAQGCDTGRPSVWGTLSENSTGVTGNLGAVQRDIVMIAQALNYHYRPVEEGFPDITDIDPRPVYLGGVPSDDGQWNIDSYLHGDGHVHRTGTPTRPFLSREFLNQEIASEGESI